MAEFKVIIVELMKYFIFVDNSFVKLLNFYLCLMFDWIKLYANCFKYFAYSVANTKFFAGVLLQYNLC